MAAEALVDSGGKGPFGIVNDPALLLIQPIFKGMRDELRENGAGARVQVVDVSVAKPPEQNVATLTTFLQRNREIKQVLLVATVLATGAFQPLRGAGLLKGIKVIGSYPNETDVDSIRKGDLSAAIGVEHDFGYRESDMLARLITKSPIEDRTPLGGLRVLRGPAVTPADLDPPDFQDVFRRAWGIAQ
jgi:ABC-type sugar transport system substrate-binding protein